MPSKNKIRVGWKARAIAHERERDAALAGQHALQRRLDEANATLEATKTWRARVSAEAAKTHAEDRATNMHYIEREHRLRADLKETIDLLRANGWEHSMARGWHRQSVAVADPYGQSPGMLALLEARATSPARRTAALEALRPAVFSDRVNEAILGAIVAYLNPNLRSESGRSAQGAEVPASPPGETLSRDR